MYCRLATILLFTFLSTLSLAQVVGTGGVFDERTQSESEHKQVQVKHCILCGKEKTFFYGGSARFEEFQKVIKMTPICKKRLVKLAKLKKKLVKQFKEKVKLKENETFVSLLDKISIYLSIKSMLIIENSKFQHGKACSLDEKAKKTEIYKKEKFEKTLTQILKSHKKLVLTCFEGPMSDEERSNQELIEELVNLAPKAQRDN